LAKTERGKMKSDSQIQKDVILALEWDPSISHELIGVSTSSGVVTLSGDVPSYFEKVEAEKIAQRVGGVKAVVEKIEVRMSDFYIKDDQEIAEAIINQFKWNYTVPHDKIKIRVEKGWVELKGEVEWEFQREAAKSSIQDLIGVKGISNKISLKEKQVDASAIKRRIETALKNEAKQEAGKIAVDVIGGTVTLTGDVHSFAEMDDAKWAAWAAPGVSKVKNNLNVKGY
jgi:osmotically-inducible protein OsmY